MGWHFNKTEWWQIITSVTKYLEKKRLNLGMSKLRRCDVWTGLQTHLEETNAIIYAQGFSFLIHYRYIKHRKKATDAVTADKLYEKEKFSPSWYRCCNVIRLESHEIMSQ